MSRIIRKIAVFLAVLVVLSVRGWSAFGMHVFNVGSASFTLVQYQNPRGQTLNYIVDCGYDTASKAFHALGPDEDSVVGMCLGLMNGVPATVILSHADVDHCNLIECFPREAVKRVVVGAGSQKKHPPLANINYVTIENLQGGHSSAPSKDDASAVAEGFGFKDDLFSIQILLPQLQIGNQTGENQDSLSVMISFAGRRILTCGDAGSNLLASVMQAYPGVLDDLDVLILPHHGSVTDGQGIFVDALRPKLCIVSTRPNARYGFPRPFWKKMRLSWAPFIFTAPHKLSCVSESGFGDEADVIAPIFSTFDSSSLFYRVVINPDGRMFLEDASKRPLFCSLPLVEDNYLHDVLQSRTPEARESSLLSLLCRWASLPSPGEIDLRIRSLLWLELMNKYSPKEVGRLFGKILESGNPSVCAVGTDLLKQGISTNMNVMMASPAFAAAALISMGPAIDAKPEILQDLMQFIGQLYEQVLRSKGVNVGFIHALAPIWRGLAVASKETMIDMFSRGMGLFMTSPAFAAAALGSLEAAIGQDQSLQEGFEELIDQLQNRAAESSDTESA